MAALFPHIATFSLANTAESSRDTTAVRRFTSVIVSTDGPHRLTSADRQQLAGWLKARIHADSLVIVEK